MGCMDVVCLDCVHAVCMHQCSMVVICSLFLWCYCNSDPQIGSPVQPAKALMCQGGERELVLGVDDQLLAASPRSIPRADVAELCVQALLLPEARNRRVSNKKQTMELLLP